MTNRKLILPYSKISKTIKSLAQNLDCKVIRLENSKYKPQEGDIIINWGNSSPQESLNLDSSKIILLNKPEKIRAITNKLKFFNKIDSFEVDNKPRIPNWTQSFKEVTIWLDNNEVVFARTKLTGHSGEGIEIILPENKDLSKFIDGHTLFVKYVKKKDEYRIHFNNGKIFDIQRKARVRDQEYVNYKIRSHSNGFVYSRNDISTPPDVVLQAEKTIVLLDIDFGAIDIIYNKLHNKAYVLEINTAPGLEGTTLNNYIDVFKEYMKQ